MGTRGKLIGASANPFPGWRGFAMTIAACIATAALATPLAPLLDQANIVMLFLLTVLLVAVSLGRGAAVLAAFLSVALFDFFFVPPQFSMAVSDLQYLVTFAVMLAVALITGQLTAGLRRQAQAAQAEEQRTRALYEITRDLAGALTLDQVVAITRQFLRSSIFADAGLLVPGNDGQLQLVPDRGAPPPAFDLHLALMARDGGHPIECDDLAGSGCAVGYFPLKAPIGVRGVLAIAPTGMSAELIRAQRALLETVASLVAIAVERIHYVEVAQATQVQIESERLRSSVLSALSHDLRTPLTALVGLADSLTLARPPLPEPSREAAEALREQAIRMSGLVTNLLDMARLHAGQVTLRKEWQPLEEVVGASLKLLGTALSDHPLEVSLAADLPLLCFDAVLIERVLCNLLENAAKYSLPGAQVSVRAERQADDVLISVCDRGKGFPADAGDRLFELFVRGTSESATPGVGLGLAISRAIVEAHGGAIEAVNRPDGGACVRFTLPIGFPPVIDEEER